MLQKALIVVDVQNDFCPGGALAVPQGDEVVPTINQLILRQNHVILTQDWHPVGHASFASAHSCAHVFDSVTLDYGDQVLWPDHCVQGSHGACFHPHLITDKAELIVRKGFHPTIDSYSAFFENDRKTPTGLQHYLKERGFNHLVFCGLATDFCVAYSALDAVACGFEASVILDACRAIDRNDSLEIMLNHMQKMKVNLLIGGQPESS